MRNDITTPVGRIVMGNLYEPRRTDGDGNPLVVKNGVNAGQPRVDYFIALAIPKMPGHTHWNQTEWGAKLYAVGQAAFPALYQIPTFAWKIQDGDSRIPNTAGKIIADREGCAGNWVLFFSSSFAPKIVNADASAMITEVGAVKPGYFVQVNFTPKGNDNQKKPGIYLNYGAVALSAYGPEIQFGPNVSEMGFGGAPLPAGASTTPVAQATFAPPPAVAAVPPPPAAVIPPALDYLRPLTMTAKAAGATAEQFRQAGYTDEMMIAQGYATK